MQTVQFRCSQCGKLMAVTTDNLGAQVHCPHCREIVRAPLSADSSPAAAEEVIPEIRVPAREAAEEGSIFNTPEPDLFGGGPESPVELPREPAPAKQLHEMGADDRELSPAAPAPMFADAATGATSWSSSESSQETELPRDVVRRPPRRSNFVPLLLVFLIPYSLACTAYIIITLLSSGNSFDPLERLPDPKASDGGPRVAPESPLPDKLKTSLRTPIHIGDIEVTPLQVVLAGDDLSLHLKMRNVSKNVFFNPFPDSFARYRENSRPYTFLEVLRGRPLERAARELSGGYVRWRKNGRDALDGTIGPGEENVTILSLSDTARPKIPRLLKDSPSFVWRVQVRRGFVSVRGKQVSATAVVGVVFSPAEVERGQAEAAAPLRSGQDMQQLLGNRRQVQVRAQLRENVVGARGS